MQQGQAIKGKKAGSFTGMAANRATRGAVAGWWPMASKPPIPPVGPHPDPDPRPVPGRRPDPDRPPRVPGEPERPPEPDPV